MKLLKYRIKSNYTKYRTEILITLASIISSAISSVLVALVLNYRNPLIVGFYAFGIMVVIIMFALLFNQKRLIDLKFTTISDILADLYSYESGKNQFFIRKQHFLQEKNSLAEVLVKAVLPNLVDKIFKENSNLTRLNIIIDSGTTLTPVFKQLIALGIANKKSNVALHIYTNSLSGIEEIHRFNYDDVYSTLTERDFNLIGGLPLNNYRATTGPTTQHFLESLWEVCKKDKEHIVTIGILTANWFLAGAGLDRISICARGPGHLDFKKSVCKNSDYKILVAPLGKLLRMGNLKTLNNLPTKYHNEEEYNSFELLEDDKAYTYLLTTLRRKDSLSPFVDMSIQLKNLQKSGSAINYKLCKESQIYVPQGNTTKEVFTNEVPHLYIRDNLPEAYGIQPN